jgi:uridylate kinase
LSGVRVDGLVERFALYPARAMYDRGRVLIFVFGTGNPAFTTDTAVALRAVELGARTIIKGTKVDGVYDRDPVKDRKARLFRRLTYQEAISKRLGVMDSAAFSLCAEHKVKIHVFNLNKHRLSQAVLDPRIGTIVS